jgi:UDP-N-acetylglucosamine--N-acetylmuramyl-(pentapeptide) pyrophosphoryl-undecaprenol N-acetylglucosamine transferase
MHFLFGAGGTGGHLYPALAVAEALKKIDSNFKITFTGRSDKIEGTKVKDFGFDFLPVEVRPLIFKPGIDSIKNVIRLIKARNRIVNFIKNNNCNAVIVAGAYISIPPGFAAAKAGTPLFLMESNVNPGKAISLLTARSKAVFTSFNESINYFPKKFRNKLILTGNPVRNSFENKISQSDAKIKLGYPPEKPLILVFGGSLGAESINSFVLNNYTQFLNKSISVAWQTGLSNKVPESLPDGIKVYQYIDDMATFYAAADLVVSRSGASTVSELSLCAKPSILVPYPSASNNEQLRNAEILQQNGAALFIPDKEIHSNLLNIVLSTIFDTEKLSKMSKQVAGLAKPGAADLIATNILKYISYE